MKIAILGAGAFGTALGGILASNGYDIDYYDSKVEREKLSEVLLNSKYVVLAIPSSAAPYVLPYIPKEKPLIVATKGFLDGHNFTDFKDVMILSGPGFAEDIKAGKKTLLTATDQRIVELFGTEYLTFDFTTDKNGVLMCGALKNVYAILAGFLDYRPKTQALENFLKEVAEEMKALLSANGANPETVDLSCGIGDLRLTCDTPSRNYQFGQEVRKNGFKDPKKTVEGLTALEKIKRGELKKIDTAKRLIKLIDISKNWR